MRDREDEEPLENQRPGGEIAKKGMLVTGVGWAAPTDETELPGACGDILVVQGATEAFNPTIDASAERALDPAAAISEYDAQFRLDLNAYLDDESIDRAIDYDRPIELPPQEDIVYEAFTDANAGGSDAYGACVAHKVGDDYIVDAVRGTYGGDPEVITQDYADLLRSYRITKVTGDNFAKEWVAGAWRKLGFEYIKSPKAKSELYLECIPLWLRGAVRIPNDPRLVRELRLLERQTHRSGKDTISHPRNEHDDRANAVCGALWVMSRKAMRPEVPFCIPYVSEGTPRNVPGGINTPATVLTAPSGLNREVRVHGVAITSASNLVNRPPTAPPPAPSEPPKPEVQGGPPPDVRKDEPPAPMSVNGGPPVAKSAEETRAQMAKVNADRSAEHRIMTQDAARAGRRSWSGYNYDTETGWRNYAGGRRRGRFEV
jgi:hypothetical protein